MRLDPIRGGGYLEPMHRRLLSLLGVAWMTATAWAQPVSEALLRQPWYELRTPNFNLYAFGAAPDTAKLAGRLEQFRAAYAGLAGSQAVASPPVSVMLFPNDIVFRPYKPVYDGKPAHLRGFFKAGAEENMIAMELSGGLEDALETIYHEYAHLLFRHNQRVWPLWLREGMADFYAGFRVNGSSALIGVAPVRYTGLLARKPLMPLSQLMRLTQESPEYRDPPRQALLYAQSWLLTHYLIVGDRAVFRPGLARFTTLRRQGQNVEAALTNALNLGLPTLEERLRAYAAAAQYGTVSCSLPTNVLAPVPLAARRLTPTRDLLSPGESPAEDRSTRRG